MLVFEDGMFHPPMMSSSSRVAPSPATSAHDEHDSTSNLSWPSTPVSSRQLIGHFRLHVVAFWWSGAGVVICLERGADLHIAQLMPLPLTVSCFGKIQIGFTFLVPAHPGSPRQRALKRVFVCACVCCCCCL